MKRLRISVEGKSYDVEVELLDEGFTTPAPQASAGSARVAVPSAPAPAAGGEGSIASPLAAVVVSVDVAIGDVVEEGQTVITLEAMKMNTIVIAPCGGTVSAIHVSAADAVEEGQAMVTLT